MTFLKKIGQILAKGVPLALEVLGVATPFIQSANPKAGAVAATAQTDLQAIQGVIATVETVIQTPGSGAVKLAAATPLVAAVIQASQAFDGKKIDNPDLFTQGASKIASGVADCMNAIHPDVAQAASGTKEVIPSAS